MDLKHMDSGSRNQRLRETLEGMGLYVVPVFSEQDPERIDWLQVSSGIPEQGAKVATGANIVLPEPGTNVVTGVSPANGERDNVINMPPKG